MKRSSCVLGIDLGTSAIKVVAISPAGQVVAIARESYGTIATCEGQAEQDCEHWLKALSRATKKVRSRLAPSWQVETIALTGQMPTMVVLGGSHPLGHAITWQDCRADRWLRKRLDRDLSRDIYRRTGIVIDGRYLAPMFQFHYGWKRVRADLILSAKDFLFHALTGLAATDPSTASGYGLYNLSSKSWDTDLCKFWDISAERLPSIKISCFSAPLSRRGSKLLDCAPGTPVVLGCADSVAGVHAINGGEQSNDSVTILTGSSVVIMKSVSEPRWDSQSRYLITPLARDGTYGLEADLLAGGSAREWAETVFLPPGNSRTGDSIWRSAHDVAPGADGLLFAPYLAGGEQGILWNPELRGMVVGLTLAHNSAHIARAMLEGMLFEIRRCLELFEKKGRISFARVSGWITEIPEELHILADILGRPVHAYRLESASAVGAALVGGLIDIRKLLSNARTTVTPRNKRTRYYNQLYAEYVRQFR